MDKNNNRYTTTEKNVIVLFGCLTMIHTHASEYHNIQNECYVNDIVHGKKKKKFCCRSHFVVYWFFFSSSYTCIPKEIFHQLFFCFVYWLGRFRVFNLPLFFSVSLLLLLVFFVYLGYILVCLYWMYVIHHLTEIVYRQCCSNRKRFLIIKFVSINSCIVEKKVFFSRIFHAMNVWMNWIEWKILLQAIDDRFFIYQTNKQKYRTNKMCEQKKILKLLA